MVVQRHSVKDDHQGGQRKETPTPDMTAIGSPVAQELRSFECTSERIVTNTVSSTSAVAIDTKRS